MSRIERTELRIPRDLRFALMLCRIRSGVAAKKPTVSRESVHEVERGLGISLPRPLLAVFAATGRDPYEMLVLTEELRYLYELSPGLVAVTQQSSRSRVSKAPTYWCLDGATATHSRCDMLRWSVAPNDRRSGLSILEFVRACYLHGRVTEEETIAVHGLSSRFRPAIVSQPRPAFRRVVHQRFGPGFVLREFNDGNHKIEVDFPSVGVKLLLASYVQDAPETGEQPSRTRRGARCIAPRATA